MNKWIPYSRKLILSTKLSSVTTVPQTARWIYYENMHAKHTFIKIHQNARNKGCNQNFHDTFKFVSKETDYIAISDQDDIWFPEKVEKLVQSIEKKKGYDLCFSDIISSPTCSHQQTKDYLPLPFTAESLFFRDNIPGHAIAYKKDFYRKT